MRVSFVFGADRREKQGKGASRRLRHSGKVPAILYGGGQPPQALVLDQQNLLTMIGSEKFYSSIVQLKIENQSQEAIVKDVQMHPARNVVVHVDLQRVVETEKIRIRLPIHFRNEGVAPGVKTQGGIVSHLLTDVEVACLPKDLPEFLEVDLAEMNLNETKFLADIPLPTGVVIADLAHAKNQPVVSIHSPRAEEPEAAPAEAAAVPAEGAAAPAAAAGAAAPAAGATAPAAGADAKKEAAPAKKEGASAKKEGKK
ncbi:MAG TPA: 50S ribosomal protein L25/general stress protein Ctc [Steroidobacteraceae bacterium]|nr:50S ribosomal protein L25/general stress protein Ctc [Steroidobacteraceae bacterium]